MAKRQAAEQFEKNERKIIVKKHRCEVQVRIVDRLGIAWIHDGNPMVFQGLHVLAQCVCPGISEHDMVMAGQQQQKFEQPAASCRAVRCGNDVIDD